MGWRLECGWKERSAAQQPGAQGMVLECLFRASCDDDDALLGGRVGFGGHRDGLGGFVLLRNSGESFGFDALQLLLSRCIFSVFRVVVVSTVARWCLITIAKAVVAGCVLTRAARISRVPVVSRVSRIVAAGAVFGIVVGAAVAGCVLIAVAPTVVAVIEINAGAL